MIRFLAVTTVLFAVPFAAYTLWLVVSQRRRPRAADWPFRVVITLCVFGAVFVLIGLIILVLGSVNAAREADILAMALVALPMQRSNIATSEIGLPPGKGVIRPQR